jgi:hypothetical protein
MKRFASFWHYAIDHGSETFLRQDNGREQENRVRRKKSERRFHMPSLGDLVPVADASAFIFTGSIARAGTSTISVLPVDAATVVVSVEDVIKAPLGLRGLAGREVTVQLLHPLAAGKYVFFADPLAVGSGIAVKERAHLEGTAGAQTEATEAVERGYAALIVRRAEAAFLVALGKVGTVRPLFTPAEQRKHVPWALAPFEIERVLKGKEKLRQVTLLGPHRGSKRLPRAPALRAGLRAILFLHHPPAEATESVPENERRGIAFIAEPSDIQPPDRLETIVQIINGAE